MPARSEFGAGSEYRWSRLLGRYCELLDSDSLMSVDLVPAVPSGGAICRYRESRESTSLLPGVGKEVRAAGSEVPTDGITTSCYWFTRYERPIHTVPAVDTPTVNDRKGGPGNRYRYYERSRTVCGKLAQPLPAGGSPCTKDRVRYFARVTRQVPACGKVVRAMRSPGPSDSHRCCEGSTSIPWAKFTLPSKGGLAATVV